jgi:hypothetical protein
MKKFLKVYWPYKVNFFVKENLTQQISLEHASNGCRSVTCFRPEETLLLLTQLATFFGVLCAIATQLQRVRTAVHLINFTKFSPYPNSLTDWLAD